MFKYIFIILILISLSNCSIKNSVNKWNIKKDIKDKDISKLNFDNEPSFNEFKKNVIKYGELSDFPKLD
tara:strand:+ start:50 stop:256 length:207 start_codon:yes stop_codon:yes gene_type:complete